MFNEIIETITYFMTPDEIVFGIFGLIFIVIIWILGGKYEKQEQKKQNMKK